MNVYLIRHTRVAVQRGVCYGRSDVRLAQTFDEELVRLREKLPGTFHVVYSSPLSRCVRLAECLSSSVHVDARLQEYDFGQWEMMRWDDIDKEEPWFSDFVNTPAPDGESFAQMYERVATFWQEVIVPLRGYEDVAIVTHAGVIRALLALILEMPLSNTFQLSISNASVTNLNVWPTHVQVEAINR